MRVLIYTHGFAPQVGGVETFAMLLARGLSRSAGMEVTVATPTPGSAAGDHGLPFATVRRPSLVGLARLVRNADVVQLAGPCMLPLLLAGLWGKPVVVEQHGYQAVCPNGLLFHHPSQQCCPGHFQAGRYFECLRCNAGSGGWFDSLKLLLLTFARRWMCRRARLHACISQHVRDRIRLPHAQVLYYGIEDPAAAETHSPMVLATRPGHFAYVGRLVREKGLPVLLEAAGLLKAGGYDFRIWLIGDGPERGRLHELACSLGLQAQVTMTGFLGGAELEAALAEVGVVVMPSVWEETAGLAAIEQMMRGRVVVAADIGGLSEVVGDAGLKFSPGDAQGLALCLRRILENPALLRELGPKARARAVRLFRHDHMIEQYVLAYRQVLGAP